MTVLGRWNDDRLDDLAREVHVLTDASVTTIRLEGQVEGLAKDLGELIRAFSEFKREESRKETEQHKERKSDRRWMIGTALTSAALVISALAVFFA